MNKALKTYIKVLPAALLPVIVTILAVALFAEDLDEKFAKAITIIGLLISAIVPTAYLMYNAFHKSFTSHQMYAISAIYVTIGIIAMCLSLLI